MINNITSIFQKRKNSIPLVAARVPLQHLRGVACPKTKRLDRAIFRWDRKRRVIFANALVDRYELGVSDR